MGAAAPIPGGGQRTVTNGPVPPVTLTAAAVLPVTVIGGIATFAGTGTIPTATARIALPVAARFPVATMPTEMVRAAEPVTAPAAVMPTVHTGVAVPTT